MKAFIRSRRTKFGVDGHPALSAQPDGSVQANRFGLGREWEEWEVEDRGEQEGSKLISLRGHHGLYLSADSNKVDVNVNASEVGNSELWLLVDKGGGFVALKSCHDKYLVCDSLYDCGKVVKADRLEVKEWEQWSIVNQASALVDPGSTIRLAASGTLIAVSSVLTVGAVAVPMLGFGAGGVVAGSTAAAVQSLVYGGGTGGLFSVLQSVGATLGWVPVAVVGGGITGVCAAYLIMDDEHREE